MTSQLADDTATLGNPKANGTSTLLNLHTWAWLDDPVDSGTISASAGNSSVTVNVIEVQNTVTDIG